MKASAIKVIFKWTQNIASLNYASYLHTTFLANIPHWPFIRLP